MTVQTAPAHRPASRPVKSPLAAHSHGTAAIARTRTAHARDVEVATRCLDR